MKFISVTILLIISKICFSQQITGKIENINGLPVPFATIYLKNLGAGTIADESGNFSLVAKSHSDTLIISSLGYHSSIFSVNYFQENSIIKLEPKSYEMAILTVKPEDPIKYLNKVLENIKTFRPEKTYTYNAFYRQTHKENERAARLLECDLTIYFNPERTGPKLKETFKVNELRRSNVYERNGDTHDNHLNDLLAQNMLLYPTRTVLNKKGWNSYKFNIFYNQIKDCESCIIITYSYNNIHDIRIDNGSISIDTADYSIIEIRQSSFLNSNYSKGGYENTGRWKYLNGDLFITFKKINNKLYPDCIDYSYKHLVADAKITSSVYLVEENFFLKVNKINDEQTIKGFQEYVNLYNRHYVYKKDFWEHHAASTAYPLDEAFRNDIERKESLEIQFQKNQKAVINQ
jgi:hypothetical protein